MRILLFAIFLMFCSVSGADAQDYKWKSVDMDASRTGCTAVSGTDVEGALGTFRGDVYVSPNGREFSPSSSTAAVARAVIDAQPGLTGVKAVVAHSSVEMPNAKSENMLSRWFVELVMNKVSAMAGRKVDIGICNFGGLRLGMPKGEVIKDDIISMFPFKNYLVYLELTGEQLRKIFEDMAAGRFQAVGGVKIVVEDKKLISVMVGGEPLEDDKVYSIATISFLLNGGDGLSLAQGAQNMMITDVLIVDAVLEHLAGLEAEGKSITGTEEQCVIIK